MSRLQCHFLGPFQITLDGKPAPAFRFDKIRALLAYLVIESDLPHRREALAALLWPEEPDVVARQNLRQALYQLRQILGENPESGVFLLVTRQTAQFNPDSDHTCDLLQFRRLLADCDTHDHQQLERCEECISRLREAADLYKGDLLQGFFINDSREFEEWLLLERDSLRGEMMRSLTRLAGYYEESGDYDQALHYTQWQLKLEPWREEAHLQAMRLLSRTGQRSAALAQYEVCRRALAEELGLEPARETTSLYERIRDAESGYEPQTASRRFESPVISSVPLASTPLIGREAEVTYVVEMMLREDIRLLTVTGPGGVGKTRTAVQGATDLIKHFVDGVYFVDLAPITDHRLVAAEIAHELGVKETPDTTVFESLIAHLHGKHLLLVLDNFEQVADAAPLIGQLIKSTSTTSATAGLKVLVTSRVSLQLRGTHEFAVSPMSLPDRKQLPPMARLTGYEAIRLFSERASALKPGFEITEENAPIVVEICHRLDGLPLAIELAAARIKVLPPRAMLARLQNRLELTAGRDRDVPARQQTLRNTIQWSYDLLTEEEKQLLRHIAVFQGRCTLEAIEAVCSGRGPRGMSEAGGGRGSGPQAVPTPDRRPSIPLTVDVLERVESLVSKSLLQQREGFDGEPRFWMLETIHEYAREKLVESGEGDMLGRAHARYYTKLTEEAEPLLKGERQQGWLDRLEEEQDNLRAALAWSRERDGVEDQVIGLRIGGAIGYFWEVIGHITEGREQLAASLASSIPSMSSTVSTSFIELPTGMETINARSKALAWAGRLAYQQGDNEAAKALGEEALAGYRQAGDQGDKCGIAFALNNLGNVANNLGEFQEASSFFEQSLAIRREIGDKWGIAVTLNNLGHVAFILRELEVARSRYEQSLAIRREIGDKWGMASSLSNLGTVAFNLKDYETARSLLEQSLAISRERGDKRVIANALNAMGGLSYMQGEYEAARSLYEQSRAIRREIGDKKGVGITLNNLGNVAYMQGEYEAAHTFHKQSLAAHQEIGDKEMIALSLGGLGEAAIKLGQVDDAKGEESLDGATPVKKGARLLGASDALYEAMGSVREPDDRIPYEHATEAARIVLGEEEVEKLREDGRAMSMEQAITYALGSAAE